MSKIAFAAENEMATVSDERFSGHMPLIQRYTVFESPDKVCVVHSTEYAGCAGNYNSKSTKKYFYWHTDASFGFMRNRAGTIQPYYARRAKGNNAPWTHGSPAPVFNMLDGAPAPISLTTEDTEKLADAFRNSCKRSLGITRLEDLYPMAAVMGISRYMSLPNEFRPVMRKTTDWNEFVTGTFGKKRTTPALVKAVRNTEPYVAALAHQLRGYAYDANLLSMMENNSGIDEEIETVKEVHNPYVRWAFKYTPANTANLLAREVITSDDILTLNDSAGAFKYWYKGLTRETYKGSVERTVKALYERASKVDSWTGFKTLL